MLRSVLSSLVASQAILLLSACFAHGQPMSDSPTTLGPLEYKSVQTELEITAAELASLRKLATESPQNQQALEKLLGSKRTMRLKEITRQIAGPEILLTDPDIAAALKLTEPQRASVQAHVEDSYAKRLQLIKNLQKLPLGERKKAGTSPEFQAAYLKAMQESKRQALLDLTKDQQAAYEKLEGKAFEFVKPE